MQAQGGAKNHVVVLPDADMEMTPFSGWKDSFFGVVHSQGRDGIEFYTDKEVVIERWPKEWSRKF